MNHPSPSPRRRRTLWMSVTGLLLVLLAAGVFTLGSLNTPIVPRTRSELVSLFALSTFLIVAFIVFLVVFGRALLRSWAERQAGRPGSRFRWKMVMGALAISLLPIIFMFFISYGLWNRTLNKWFPLPLETAAEQSQQLIEEMEAHLPPEGHPQFAERRAEIERQVAIYQAQKAGLREYKTSMLLALGVFTLVLLFSVTWFALFLSKMVTVPIESLARATGEIAHGNFDYRVEVTAHDELAGLVQSFNQMTAQLGESRRQIDEFTRSLQVAVQELERQKRVIEAIVENIPTGVVSLDNAGNITRVNPAFMKMLGEHARQARILPELLGEEAVRGVQSLMRKSLRMGTASKELEIVLPGRVLHAAVTVTSLGPRRANPGYIVVVDDLTEVLRAQKSAAWQEVAQRIAHEIKNPLTPIQLSSQRLLRHLGRTEGSPDGGEELRKLTAECAALIEREVSTLKSLVDEFSQFARFPTARPVPSSVNAIVGEALEVFHGRLDGVSVRTRLAGNLPQVRADRELLRRVVINLIDNAAEAIESSSLREIEVATQLDPDGDAVEIIVADSGHGISPEDKDRLFLPHFSTRDRGTGLGLAIANRIVAEHNGAITVEDNLPVGARFIIRLPAVEVAVPEAVPPAT